MFARVPVTLLLGSNQQTHPEPQGKYSSFLSFLSLTIIIYRLHATTMVPWNSKKVSMRPAPTRTGSEGQERPEGRGMMVGARDTAHLETRYVFLSIFYFTIHLFSENDSK